MDLTDKIKQILVDKNITPSLFADEIGIQRSSMSHILAGRNKPSLDMVQKIVKRFPDLGISWILDDEPLPEIAPEPANEPVLESRKKVTSAPQPAQPNLVKEKPVVLPEKKIEKVLIFYSDGTFQEYKHA
ncbi:Helix-turn-helix [Dyadobacter soli]|uniref:Helix-turn-helix n=1 Tax=Dyadobacter soli TaxID=659014 RepID=A0A1G7KPG6_9BACT|nr:helix-turn-helix domain-containing protein [Dyadobacter soli]SDF39148.1 Helix-turn-helix [Dyadobacter soli]